MKRCGHTTLAQRPYLANALQLDIKPVWVGPKPNVHSVCTNPEIGHVIHAKPGMFWIFRIYMIDVELFRIPVMVWKMNNTHRNTTLDPWVTCEHMCTTGGSTNGGVGSSPSRSMILRYSLPSGVVAYQSWAIFRIGIKHLPFRLFPSPFFVTRYLVYNKSGYVKKHTILDTTTKVYHSTKKNTCENQRA